MNAIRRHALAALAALVASSSAIPAFAQDSTHGGGRERRLGGHYFIPSSNMPDVFVDSYLRSLTGFGVATNLEVPISNLEDSVVQTASGDLAFLSLDFEYQQRVTRWLALRAGLSSSARAGIDKFSFLAEGLSAVYGFSFGATARLWHNDKAFLSAALDHPGNSLFGTQLGSYLQGVGSAIKQSLDSLVALGTPITPAVIDSVIHSIDLSSYSVTTSSSTSRTTGGLRAAWAPKPWLGLTGFAHTGVGRALKGSAEKGLFDLGATAGVDFGRLSSVPIGVLLSGRWQSLNEKGSDLGGGSTSFGLGVSYTGRSDFSVGLELGLLRLKQNSTGTTISTKRAGFAMRYYF